MSSQLERAFVDGHNRLVQVAYLALLPTGSTTAEGRAVVLRRARVIVRRAMLVRTLKGGGGAPDYQEWRRRVLRRVLGGRPPRRHRHWLTVAPEVTDAEAERLVDALGRLTATQAVQYALRMSENLSAEETAAELDAAGVTVADDVVAKVEERTGLPEADQRALLTGRAFDTAVLHVRTTGLPRSIRIARHRSRLLAGALAVVVAAAGVVWLTAASSQEDSDFVTHGASDAASDVTEWPLRGNLRGDKDLMRRAVAYWNFPDQVGLVEPPDWRAYPTSTPTVVFAGDVSGERVVVMADEHSIARYDEAPDHRRRIFVSAYGHVNLHPRGLIQLLGTPGERDTQTPYLVPPGVTRVLAAELGATRPAWRPVPVRDGVATQWPTTGTRPDGDCSMLMVALTRPFNDGVPRTDTYTDVGDTLITAPIDYSSPTAATPPLDAQAVGLLRAVRCLGAQARGEPDGIVDRLRGALLQVSIDPFWQGRLPETPAHVAFATVIVTTTTGQNQELAQRMLVAPDDPRYAGETMPHAGPEHPLSGEADATYGSHWWKAPSGHWYLIVGGSPDVTRIRVWGQVDQRVSGNSFVLRGPKGKTPPSTVVTAVDKRGIPATLP